MLTRRSALQTLAGAGLTAALRSKRFSASADDQPLTPTPDNHSLGIVSYCCSLRRNRLMERDGVDLFEPARFLVLCRSVGAGGMQCELGMMSHDDALALKASAEALGMFIEAIISPPEDEADVERFSQEMQTASQAGAKAARTVIIPGRRYERFQTLEEFQEFAARGRRMLELAAPIAEHFGLPLAVENHKDQRIDERLELFEHIDSEFVGACVDTGNSLALLEDPLEAVRSLAPWAHAVHLKDQAVEEYADGFLLGDIPLGQGALDLAAMVDVLRAAKPGMRFCLELITRDPLRVPCLTEGYWATFPDVPRGDLDRTMAFVREHATGNLQYVSERSAEEQASLEDDNVRASLEYSRSVLGMVGS